MFKITRDFLTPAGEDGSAVGQQTPDWDEAHYQAHKADPTRFVKFRLMDDDREVYYHGVSNAPEVDTEDAWGAPLWHFGEGYAGCAIIQHKAVDGSPLSETPYQDGVWYMIIG